MNLPVDLGSYTNMLTGDGQTLNTGATASVTSAAFSNVSDYRYVVILVTLGSIAGGGGLSVLKVQSATTSGGSYGDITGGDIVAAGTTIGDTADNNLYAFVIDTRGKNQHFKVVATTAGAVNTVVKSINGFGMFSKNTPVLATGLTGVVYV